ncbi:MAG: ribosome-associated translation inhibitor RaiA [Bacillota bacterium]|nr:ribosome-associated translation inhibitor RaiA [Bacillota bacterium]
MKVIIKGRGTEVEERLREITLKKLAKLDKFFNDDSEARVTLSVTKGNQNTMEVTIFSSGMIYRAEETNGDMYSAVDKVIDVIERQIRKNKTRLERRLRSTAFEPANFEIPEIPEEKVFNIVRTKHLIIKPMSPEEAILQMNLLGHTFFVFKNAETEETNLVYKRNDKDYGLMEIN